MKNVAIIVGAGSGERFGSYKQVEIINNKPVYQYSIDAFLDTKSFTKIIIAVPKKLINVMAEQLAEEKYKNVVLCEGGDSRSQSVYNAFKMISSHKNKIFIHDAARPLIDKKTIINLIEFSKKEKAVILAKKITETVKSVKSNKSNFTVDRTNLWTSETPQVFNQEVLEEVYNKKSDIIHEYSDEAAIVEDCGYDVVIFENKNLNMKITSREDLGEITKRIGSDNFFGLGIDFHSLSKGDGIIVGGFKIKCDLKSIAHSDGDVLTHAIIDALCGALNLGDIGDHFPNTKQNKNISSIKLLEKIISMIPINISIVNVDATLVLNEPKISKHKSKIASKLATVLNISKNQISIKGSTTNRLNFIDMKNGWGAEVIITLKKWN
jgi:2-C-methyl-D-erythritol 4-phosphate cytidylyltransferase/2-C-methyl-D-erythritol 2,4-cyclodiphosphate synthase